MHFFQLSREFARIYFDVVGKRIWIDMTGFCRFIETVDEKKLFFGTQGISKSNSLIVCDLYQLLSCVVKTAAKDIVWNGWLRMNKYENDSYCGVRYKYLD